MALELTGRIVQILDLQSGTSARGDWKKQEFILETEEQYPRKICISLWGDRIGDIAGVQLGKEILTVSFTLESREFNGRWYTDVRGWRIQRGGAAPVQGAPTGATPDAASGVPSPEQLADSGYAGTGGESFDDLPF
ncbi:MAG: DUF3127 domain-containing protein [Prevotellaceae bacterium]|jgi:hypothetical protein|nr:DUF3127 domain-containing protein [Prevotellaceae bacterium]